MVLIFLYAKLASFIRRCWRDLMCIQAGRSLYGRSYKCCQCRNTGCGPKENTGGVLVGSVAGKLWSMQRTPAWSGDLAPKKGLEKSPLQKKRKPPQPKERLREFCAAGQTLQLFKTSHQSFVSRSSHGICPTISLLLILHRIGQEATALPS